MNRSKKTWVLLGIIAAIALSAIGAFAYFTAAGSGTGSATVGSASPIVITSDANPSALFPGGADQSVAVHINNQSAGNQHVNVVSGSVADQGGCSGAWFQVDPISLNATLTPGQTVDQNTAVRMLESGSNQNACQGLTLVVNWSSN